MTMENRPLSPHLQIYRWQWTMLYSILHRATGVALGVGTLLLVCWLIALSTGAEAFYAVQAFVGSWVGRALLFGWTFALFYHFANGVRHLFWDAGMGFELETAARTGHLVPVAAGALTILSWALGYSAL